MPKKALLVVDTQNCFVPGGSLPVPEGDKIVPVLNRYIEKFESEGLPVYASRDWHPPVTKHFKDYGGPWPVHCVQKTEGAQFHPDLKLPRDVIVISKGMDPNEDAYSVFQGFDTHGHDFLTSLKEKGVKHLYVGGLATDYCVRATVLSAREYGFDVTLLTDATKGVDINPGDSAKAIEEMKAAGADTAVVDEVDTSD